MKNVNYIVNGVLAVAVVILFILHFAGPKESTVTRTSAPIEGSAEGNLPIAYVNIDSLIQNYNFAKDLLEIQLRKQENAKVKINQQMNDLQKDAADFQRKIDAGAFISTERAQQEQQRILRKQQDVEELGGRLENELMVESQKMNMELRDTIISQLKQFNKDKGYQVVLSNSGGDNILLADDSYDISDEFIKFLNKNYSVPAK